MKSKSNISGSGTAVQWATKALESRHVVFISDPESVLKTPYSSVTKFTTNQGVFYLKETPPALFIEATIIKMLKNNMNAIVPSILDTNKDLHCFLMLDAGIPLREYLENNFQSHLLVDSLKAYTRIQSDSANHIEDFLKLGVPDWRLKELPRLYRVLIMKEEVLKREGLTDADLKLLQDLYPCFLSLCEILSKFHIPETIDHCDFHDNNILINPRNHQLTLIDLGEVVMTHPFFSLLSFISKKTCYQGSSEETAIEENPLLIVLLDACFENWASVLNRDDFKKAMLVAKKLWPIYSALGYQRLMSSSHMGMTEAKRLSYYGRGRNKGRFATYFKDFIADNLNIDPTDLSRVRLSYPGSRLPTKL